MNKMLCARPGFSGKLIGSGILLFLQDSGAKPEIDTFDQLPVSLEKIMVV